jgi:hypothetical protein
MMAVGDSQFRLSECSQVVRASFLFSVSLHHPVPGLAIMLVVSRLESSLRAQLVLILRPAILLALRLEDVYI